MLLRTMADEARTPKYAHVERERRWLVRADATPENAATRCIRIEDRSIDGTRLRLRRMTDLATGECALKLTRKYESADPLARPIVTAYLDAADYAALTALPARTLVKRRYAVRSGAHLYGLDRFEGALASLALAEIELADDDTLRALEAPRWTVRDVSHESRYEGGSLARNGLPQE